MTKLSKWMVMAALSCLWACGSPEQATVDQFFRAAQDNDPVTLSYMSAVSAPLEVESWKVVEVTSRTTEPYELPALVKEFKAAEAERNTGLEERKTYFTENQDDLEQIIPKLRDDPEYQFKGKLGEIQAEWLRLADDRKEKERVYQEFKRNVDRETSIASKSVMRQIPVAELSGNVAVTEMLVNLKAPNLEELPFKLTLRKYDLTEGEADRTEQSRWVIVDVSGASPEAVAAAAAAKEASEPVAQTAAAESEEADEPAEVAEVARAPRPARVEEPAREEAAHLAKELRGAAKVQTLAPVTRVEGNEVISVIKVRNASADWITGFTVTEHWYDQQGNAVGTSSRTHRERFMPGEVIELELRIRKDANFFQNQYLFSHTNGEVNATVVASFPNT